MKSKKYDAVLWGGFAFLIVVIMVIALTGMLTLNKTNQLFDQAYKESFAMWIEAEQLTADLKAMQSAMKDVAHAESAVQLESAIIEVDKNDAEINRSFSSLLKINRPNPNIYNIMNAYKDWSPIRAKTIEFAKNGQYEAAEENMLTAEAAQAALINNSVQLFTAYEKTEIETTRQYAENAAMNSLYQLLVLSLVAILLSVSISLLIRKKLIDYRTQLYEEKEYLRITLQSIGDGIISTNYNGNIITLNEAAKNLTGWLGDTAVGRPFAEAFEIINEFSREKGENIVDNVLESGKIHELAKHTILISKDGIERPIEDSAAPIRDGNGNIHGAILIFRDVTERKQAEEALQIKQKQLTDLIDFLPNATLAIDKERRVIIWNKAIEKMTGIPAAEMMGKGDYAYTIPFFGKARPQLMDLLFLSDEELVTQYPKITREGDALIVEAFCPLSTTIKVHGFLPRPRLCTIRPAT